MNNKPFQIGDPITYWPKSPKIGIPEIGIIKNLNNNKAWIVTKFDHQPTKYTDYTPNLCDLSDLSFGWLYSIIKNIPPELIPDYHQFITNYFITTGQPTLFTDQLNPHDLQNDVITQKPEPPAPTPW